MMKIGNVNVRDLVYQTNLLNNIKQRSSMGTCWVYYLQANLCSSLKRDRSKCKGTEEWYQTCRRVIEGMFDIQKRHVFALGLEWNDAKAQRTAKEAYDRLFNLKWTPPGRGLWMMGTKFIYERTGAGLFNCAFRSTKDLSSKGGYLFRLDDGCFMVGIGVGFDTLGANTLTIKEPQWTNDVKLLMIVVRAGLILFMFFLMVIFKAKKFLTLIIQKFAPKVNLLRDSVVLQAVQSL